LKRKGAPKTHGEKTGETRGVQSVETGAELLRVLSKAPGPLSLRDIAAAAAMPSSKAYQYLASFNLVGITKRDAETGHYDLGPFAAQLGLTALGQIDAVGIVTSGLLRLAADTQHDAYVTTWSALGPMVLRWAPGANDLAIRVREGVTLPLLTTATGRVWAHYLPARSTKMLIERQLQEMQPKSGKKLGDLQEHYAKLVAEICSKQGFSIEKGEQKVGIEAIAVPVFDRNGIAFVVSLLGAQGTTDFLPLSEIPRQLVEFAHHLTGQLGGSQAAFSGH
jgi:DNA-binding IclR family transcriptional regulator